MKSKPSRSLKDSPTQGAQAVRRALSVLRVVADSAPQQGVRLKDVVAQVALNAATVHRLLRVLVEEGAVDYDPLARRYRGGKELFLLGLTRPGYFPIRALAEPYARKLAELTGETVFLIVGGSNDTVVLDRKVGTGPVQVLAVEVGARLPMGLGSAGIALLARMSEDEAEAIMVANALRYEAKGQSIDNIRAGVVAARELGYALMDPGLHPGTRSLAIAVDGPDGRPAATLAISAIRHRLPPTRVPGVVATMQDIARQVSERLGRDRRGRSRG